MNLEMKLFDLDPEYDSGRITLIKKRIVQFYINQDTVPIYII